MCDTILLHFYEEISELCRSAAAHWPAYVAALGWSAGLLLYSWNLGIFFYKPRNVWGGASAQIVVNTLELECGFGSWIPEMKKSSRDVQVNGGVTKPDCQWNELWRREICFKIQFTSFELS